MVVCWEEDKMSDNKPKAEDVPDVIYLIEEQLDTAVEIAGADCWVSDKPDGYCNIKYIPASKADEREAELRKEAEFYKHLYWDLGGYDIGGTRLVYSPEAYNDLKAWLEEKARNMQLRREKEKR